MVPQCGTSPKNKWFANYFVNHFIFYRIMIKLCYKIWKVYMNEEIIELLKQNREKPKTIDGNYEQNDYSANDDMMKILKRDFSEHKTILASIYKINILNPNIIKLNNELIIYL